MIQSTEFTKAALILDEAQRKISDLIGAPITLQFKIELYSEITPRFVLETVVKVSGLSAEQIRTGSKEQKYANARFVCFWLMRTYLFMTLKDIGRYFNRDHSTVIHGLNLIETQPDNEPLQELLKSCGTEFTKGLKAHYEN